MWMQTVNKADTERVWINVTNGGAASITTHWAAFKLCAINGAASVSTNEAGPRSSVAVAGVGGLMLGLAYEDIPPGQIGVVQVYGYHESFQYTHFINSVTNAAGTAVGPCNMANSVGLGGNGLVDNYGPVITLDTVTTAMLNDPTTVKYANHCLIRCL